MNNNYNLQIDGGLITEGVPYDIIHRYERIRTSVFPTEYDGVQHAADIIVGMINDHCRETAGAGIDYSATPFALGLSTGRTPVGLYHELVKRYEKGKVSFREVAVYSLDEFYPITAQEQQSRNFRIHEDFLNHVDILPENIHIPDGSIPLDEITTYCAAYDMEASNIDLMIIGMGIQGQVGFNEPGSYRNSHTRLVALNNATRESLSSIFYNNVEDTPRMAITLGMETIMKAKRIILLAWGEEKSDVVSKLVEGDVTMQVPVSLLQEHSNIEVVVDENAAQGLTRIQAPWLVGPCRWTPKFIRKAAVWLCQQVDRPILKLTYQDYIDHSLSGLLDSVGKTYDQINIEVFNDLQHTITGWPGGKPNADDSTRPVPSKPYPKRVIVFSPHPDDDVISMGGTLHRLVSQGHNVHVAYQTSGNVAVHDDMVLQVMDTAREVGLGDRYDEIRKVIASKKRGEPEPRELLNVKGAIRRGEAKAACRLFGLNDVTNVHFLNMPFYETGGIKKSRLGEADIQIVINLLREIQPHQIYAAGDLSDPHGTHRVCIEAVLEALNRVKDDAWMKGCTMWLYRGAWQEWDLGVVDMAVPLSPEEMIAKRHAIYRHLSQKDIVPFPGADKREFWQRAEERTQNTARLYDKLGMAEYQAIEVFVRMF